MINSDQWRELEMKDAQDMKYKAAISGNLHAVLAAEGWIHAIRAASFDELRDAATTCKSVAPDHRRRAIECLGHNNSGGRSASVAASVEVGR